MIENNTTRMTLEERKIEFVVFAIEQVAQRLQRPTEEVYKQLYMLNLVKEYIYASYDALHTQGKEYIVNDIIEVMNETIKEKGE